MAVGGTGLKGEGGWLLRLDLVYGWGEMLEGQTTGMVCLVPPRSVLVCYVVIGISMRHAFFSRPGVGRKEGLVFSSFLLLKWYFLCLLSFERRGFFFWSGKGGRGRLWGVFGRGWKAAMDDGKV